MTSNLVMNDRMSDVVLKVRHRGYSWRFPAHSLLLSARSSVFREMLEERSQDEEESPITIVDMKPETTLALLRYIYLDEIPAQVSVDLLVAAEKYELDALKEQLEERLLPDLTVVQACDILEGLRQRRPVTADCPVKMACQQLLERHALRVFSTDLVLNLSNATLTTLLNSDKLNIPDESVLFWGLWRWGRMMCSQGNRSLKDKVVAAFLDDLLVLLRLSSLRSRQGIPAVALGRFNKCLCRRCKYHPPEDSLTQCSSLRTCRIWEDMTQPNRGDDGTLCLQVSFDKDVMLVGLTLEVRASEQIDAYVRLFEESSNREVLRQRVCWGRCFYRNMSESDNPERYLESEMIFFEPLVLTRNQILSIYLQGCDKNYSLPRSSVLPRRKKVDLTFATVHGQTVIAVRELHLVPDVTVSWGPRGGYD